MAWRSTASSWDLAFSRTKIRTSSGTSGEGDGGALLAGPSEVYADALHPGAGEYEVDLEIASGAPGAPAVSQNPVLAGWFDYFPECDHLVRPGDRLYYLRTSDGGYAKLRVHDWNDGVLEIALERVYTCDELEASQEPLPLDAILVDASNQTEWVYLTATGGIVSVSDPEIDAWDLRFRRTTIETHPAGGAALHEPATFPYDAIAVATDDVRDATYAANVTDWFDYYFACNHWPRPKAETHLIRTSDGSYAKLRLWRYASGQYQVSFAPLEAIPESAFVVSAPVSGTWVYLRVGQGIVMPTDPADDDGWDLAFSRTKVRTNSGTSGTGTGGVLFAGEDAMYEDLVAAPIGEYVVDALGMGGSSENPLLNAPRIVGGPPSAGNGWYDYFFVAHAVVASDRAYVVRRGDGGGYGRLRVWSWDGTSGEYVLSFESIPSEEE